MNDSRLWTLSLVEAGALIRRRELSPVELMAAVLERIEELEPRLNTFTTRVPPEAALAAARSAEDEIRAGRHRGPLHGIPVGVKDLIDTAGLRTTYGSGMFRDHVPSADGAVPERLRAAGAIIIGKTATHEFGRGITTNNFFFGPTHNPWSPMHVPGGSSGGAGAAVAAGMGPLQIGTDSGGSIRFPAAFCGVVGFKPTLGLVSNRGQFGDGSTSFTSPGPLVRTVRDAAVVTQTLAGFDPAYLYSRPEPVPDLTSALDGGVRGLRVGTSPDLLVPPPDPAVRQAFEASVARLAALGATIVEIRMPHHAVVLAAASAMLGIEGEVMLEELLGDRPRVFSPAVELFRARGLPSDPAIGVRGAQDRQRVRRDYAVAFTQVDLLVLPTAPMPAPRLDADELPDLLRCVPYTMAANLVGLPAVSIPAGMVAGLPVGLQIVAPEGADALVLRAAAALERVAPEHRAVMPDL